MDRKAFLFTLWKKTLKPTLLVILIYYCIAFFYEVCTNNGIERGLTLLILSLVLFILLIELIGSLFSKMTENLKRPKKIKKGLKIISFAMIPVLALLIYQAWQKDMVGLILILCVLLLQNIIDHRNESNIVTT